MGKLTDYGTVLLALLASEPAGRQTATQLAGSSGIALPTVSKLLKQLQRAGLVTSERGLHGGYSLARPPQDISAAAILDALEGPMALTTCSTDHGQCGIEGSCRVGSAWQKVNHAIHQSLQAITLSELAGLDKPDTHLVAFNLRLRRSFNSGHHRP